MDIALRLLRSVNDQAGDLLAEVLRDMAREEGQRPSWVVGVLPFDPADDSDNLFELRLRLTRRGYVSDLVSWSRLAKSGPPRCIQLLHAILAGRPLREPKEGQMRSRLEVLGDADKAALQEAAIADPTMTWDLLQPQVERRALGARRQYLRWRKRLASGKGPFLAYPGRVALPAPVLAMARIAARKLAQDQPEEFLKRAAAASASRTRTTQRILAAGYMALPESMADVAIQWILADPRRLKLGAGCKRPPWGIARALLARFSPHCSGKLFAALEQTLWHYHDAREYKNAKYRCRDSLYRYYEPGHFGEGQYHLLPALCPARRSPMTISLIGVLSRKLEGVGPEYFLRRPRGRGGWVTSPLRRDRLLSLSDKTWLRIIRSKLPGRGTMRHQMGKDHVGESSVEMFARDLHTAAARQPRRFARLALRIPADAPADYLGQILQGIERTKPGNEVPAGEQASWQPAAVEDIEAILQVCGISDDREQAINFCWAIRNRASGNWSAAAVNRLIEFVRSHPDLPPGRLNVHCDRNSDDVGARTLHDNAINCVRGVGAEGLAALLFEHPDWLQRLRPGIEAVLVDPHPAVRVAAVAICLATWNIDKEQAVRWFLQACDGDDRIGACHYAGKFFSHVFHLYPQPLSAIIRGMIASRYEDVAEVGASQATARWLFEGVLADEVEHCRQGSTAQRKGVAHVATRLLREPEYSRLCQQLLLPLFDDPDGEVRAEASIAFCYDGVFASPDVCQLACHYVRTKAFRDRPSTLSHALQEHAGSLLALADVVFAICERLGMNLAAVSRDFATDVPMVVHNIGPLLLRLYEQAKGQNREEIQRRCLDAWDLLLENRVSVTRQLMADLGG